MTVAVGLASAFCYGLSDLLTQRMTRICGVLGVLAWVLPTTALIAMPIALFVDGLPTSSAALQGVAYSAAAGALYLAVFFAAFAALKVGDLSVVAPLISLQAAFIVVFAAADGSTVTTVQAMAAGLAVAGGLLVSLQRRAKSAAGAGLALLSAALWALALVLFQRAGDISWLSQAAWSRLASALLFLPIAVIALRRRHRCSSASGTPHSGGSGRVVPAGCVAVGLFELMGLLASTLAVQLGPLAIAGVAVSQYATVAVILGVVLLKERLRGHQVLGVAFTVIAISLLSSIT